MAGARLRAGLRRHREGGVGGRQRRADPRAHGRGVLGRALGAARAGRARAARGRARGGGGRRGRRPRRGSSASRRAPRISRGSASFSPAAERPLVVVGEGGWTAETSRDVQAFCEANALPVACAFRCQDFVDNRSPSYVGVLGVAMDEAIAGAAARRRSRARDRRSARRGADAPLHAPRAAATRGRRSSTSIPTRRELGRVYEPDLAIVATLPEAASALRALDPVEPRWREWTAAARADYEREPRARADGGRRRPRRDHGVPPRSGSPATRSRRAAPGNFTVWAHRFAAVHAVRHAGVPALGLDGLRASGRGRRAARPPRANRRLLHGRRRLRHELARARDRRAVRPADRRAPRQQRHVRDDPHAPGAAVPGARHRHRSREPGLPRARSRVRRARRAGRADRGLRGGVRARARLREAVGARAAGRPGADQPAREAERATKGSSA